MELAQSRFVTENVEKMASFYAELARVEVVLNEYYVEIPTARQRIGVSRVHFSDFTEQACGTPPEIAAGVVILDFATGNIDAEFERIDRLGVTWVLHPTLQPWGRRSMIFRDPEGHLVNVFSDTKENK